MKIWNCFYIGLGSSRAVLLVESIARRSENERASFDQWLHTEIRIQA